jgi:hypothetical protein
VIEGWERGSGRSRSIIADDERMLIACSAIL